MLFVAFYCSFWFLVRVSICRSLPFAALRSFVFEIESILSQKQNRQMPFVARFGFLWMFPFENRIAHCGFLLVRKTKTSNKRQKRSKWKPGFSR